MGKKKKANHPGPQVGCEKCSHRYQYKRRTCPECGEPNASLNRKETATAIDNLDKILEIKRFVKECGGMAKMRATLDFIEKMTEED